MLIRSRNSEMVGLEWLELIDLPKRSGREKLTIGFLGHRPGGRTSSARRENVPNVQAQFSPLGRLARSAPRTKDRGDGISPGGPRPCADIEPSATPHS